MSKPSLGWYPPAAEQYLIDIHRMLYPEDWMTPAEIEGEIESGYLNAEGIREWKLEDLEAIGGIVTTAVKTGRITPTPEGSNE